MDVADNELLYLESVHLFVEVRVKQICIVNLAAWNYLALATSPAVTCLTAPAVPLCLQILDHYFGNVCELDLVFGFNKVYCILDEFIIGGEIQETSKKVILERLKELHALET